MLVQASVVVVIEAAEQLSDSTHIMLYSTRCEYRDTPGGPDDRRILLVQYALCSSSLCQQSDTENGWLERLTVHYQRNGWQLWQWLVQMSDSTLPHSSISYDTNSIRLIKCYSPDAVSHLSHRPLISFISHAHMISLLLYHLSFIPDPSSISPMFTYHHWHLIYCHIYQ